MAGCGGDHGSTKDGSHVTVRLHTIKWAVCLMHSKISNFKFLVDLWCCD